MIEKPPISKLSLSMYPGESIFIDGVGHIVFNAVEGKRIRITVQIARDRKIMRVLPGQQLDPDPKEPA